MSLTRTTVGIEITPQQLLVVVVRTAAGRMRVLGAASFSRTDDPRETALRVKRFFKQFPGQHEVRFCLSSPSTFVRIVDLPSVDEATLSQMIPFELERHIPFPIDQVKIDHCVLDRFPDGMSRALAALVKQEEMDSLKQLMEQIAPRRATCSLGSLAAAEFVTNRRGSESAEEGNGGIVIAEAGPSQTTITIYDGRSAFLTRTLGQLASEQLAEEIHRSVGGFHSSFRNVKADRCIVTGARACEVLPSIVNMNIPVEIMEPWSGMEPPQPFEEDPQRYLVATAAGLQEATSRLSINLLKSQQLSQRTHRKRVHWVLAAAAALILILGGSYRSFVAALHAQEADLAQVELQVQRLRKSRPAADLPAPTHRGQVGTGHRSPPLNASRPADKPLPIAEIEPLESLARDARRSSYTWLEILRALSLKLPDKVWLTQLECEKDNQATLNGIAPSNAEVAAAVQTLEKTGLFSDVRLIHSRVTETKGEEGFDFQIVCTMTSARPKEPAE